jgi:hypothetical protein
LPDFLKADPTKADKIDMRCAYDDELPGAERYRWPIERYVNGFRALRPGMEDRVIFAVIGGIPVDLVNQDSDLPRAILGDIKANASDLVTYYGDILDDPLMIEKEDFSVDGGTGILNKACVIPNPKYDPNSEIGVETEPYLSEAEPGRRHVRVAQAFGVNGVVQSICEESLASPLERIAAAITNRIKASRTTK